MRGDYLLRAVLMGAVLRRAGHCGAAEPWGDLPRTGWLLPSASRAMESEGCLLLCLQKLSERNCALWKMKLPLAGERDLE